MKKCDYGCGQEAKYRMTSGKWCCCDFYSKCPPLREKNRKGQLGKKEEKFKHENII